MKKLIKFKDFQVKESVGDIDKQFLKIRNQYANVDFKQIPGSIILSSNSETDINSIKRTLGGEVTIEDGRFILHIKDTVV